MKLSKEAIKDVLNYIIEKQTFDFEAGKMTPIYITSIVNDLSKNDNDKKQEIACAIVRCINEGFIISNYSRPAIWNIAVIHDVSLRGFMWLENN